MRRPVDRLPVIPLKATLLVALLACIVRPVAAQASIPAPVAIGQVVWEEVVVDDGLAGDDTDQDPASATVGSERFVATQSPATPKGLATFGPFRVLAADRAALVDVTDERSPAAFAAMLAAFPGIATVDMIDCPGTEDDRANLLLGRMIRARGIATHVPATGFVGSGAVELFLAGAHRSAEPGAEFAVHSWQDDTGREPRDFAADAPENRTYIEYYRAMGMAPSQASAFYAMTNSVPFSGAKWMTAAEMRQWVGFD